MMKSAIIATVIGSAAAFAPAPTGKVRELYMICFRLKKVEVYILGIQKCYVLAVPSKDIRGINKEIIYSRQ